MSTPAPFPRLPLDSSQPRKLNVVKISLSLTSDAADPSGSARLSRILFDISIRGEQVGLLDATPTEVGLPLTVAQALHLQPKDACLPNHILAALDRVVPRNGYPLWLSFPQPSGYLPILPWERLMRSRLAVPILRLSYTEVQPIIPRESLDVIICFSFPRDRQGLSPQEVIEYFVQRIPSNFVRYTTFHMFADASVQSALLKVLQRLPKDYHIKVYDPKRSARHVLWESKFGTTAAIERLDNPWLLWIRDSMNRCSADVVHFVTDGYLGREEGFLAFPRTPLLTQDQCFTLSVGARELCTFLDQVGAWSVAFSSPPGNPCCSGLKLLHDQIARIRPGPALFHDMASDPNRIALNEACQYAYALEEAPPPVSDSVSLYCHPDWAMPEAKPDDKAQRLLKELTPAGNASDEFPSSEKTPSWLASGQRSLERSVAELLSTAPDGAETSGTADALRFAAELLRRHARAQEESKGRKII